MRKILIGSLIGLSLCVSAYAHDDDHGPKTKPPAPEDKWSGSDKGMHFGVSAVLGYAARNQWPNEPLKAFGVAMIPGLLKEALDDKASGKDLAADALGAMVGVYAAGWMISHSNNTTKVAYSTTF